MKSAVIGDRISMATMQNNDHLERLCNFPGIGSGNLKERCRCPKTVPGCVHRVEM